MQKIIIKNFGPIKDVELDIQDFMVFIGPQATGKSTIAKLVYFFKDIGKDIEKLVRTPQIKWEAEAMIDLLENEIIAERFTDIFGKKSNYYQDDTAITFYYKNQYYINVTFHHAKPVISLSHNHRISIIISTILNTLAAEEYKISEKRRLMVSAFLEKMELRDSNNFIPAGRGMIANGYNYYKENTDETTRSFISLMENIKYELSTGDTIDVKANSTDTNIDILEGLMRNILKGEYVVTNEDEYIRFDSKNKISIHLASSGQQEASRLLIVLTYLLVEYEHNFVVIEEPEAHIYPAGQNEITQAMTFCFNHNVQMLITTHSPYILSAVNNLLFAQHCADKFPEIKSALESIVPQACWLKKEKIAVYYVGEGTIKSIIDQNTGLIGINELDGVSDTIMGDFDAMMEMYRSENRKKTLQ